MKMLLVLFFCAVVVAADSPEPSDEARLVNHMLSMYKRVSPLSRPLLNSSSSIRVNFAISLQKVLDIDEKNQVLTTYLWLQHEWIDEFLTWDPKEYGGLESIRLPIKDIWSPDIVLHNDVSRGQNLRVDDANVRASVLYDGTVSWIPRCITASSCDVNPNEFPFDQQTCKLKFGSWTHSILELNLEFYGGFKAFLVDNYMKNTEWDLVENSAEKNEVKYSCCDELYSDLTYELVLRRRPVYFARFMLLPMIILSILVMVIFWIPPQRPDRTGLGMSLFASFMFLLLLVVGVTPPTDESKLGVFCCYNIVGVSISIFLSVIIVNVAQKKGPMPRTLAIFVRKIAPVTCMLPAKPKQDRVTQSDDKEASDAPLVKVPPRPAPRDDGGGDWLHLALICDRIFFILYAVFFAMVMINFFPFPTHEYRHSWF